MLLISFGTLTHPFTVFQPSPAGGGLGLADLLGAVLTAVTYGAGILLFIYLVIGGFKYMSAGGDDKAIQSAKKILTNAVIGLIIIVAAWFIVAIAQTVLGFGGILELNFPGPGGT